MKARKERSRGFAAMEHTAGPVGKGAAELGLPKPPLSKGHDPAFVPTLVRRDTLKLLRKLQKSTKPKRLNLKFISEACHRIALSGDHAEIVRVAELLSQGVSHDQSISP
jgi:hypothetical protein